MNDAYDNARRLIRGARRVDVGRGNVRLFTPANSIEEPFLQVRVFGLADGDPEAEPDLLLLRFARELRTIADDLTRAAYIQQGKELAKC